MSRDLRRLTVKSTLQKKKYKGDYWARLKILKENSDGLDYFDILVGKKNDEHAHYGFHLDGSLKFRETRDKIHSERKEVESKKYGKLIDKQKQFKDTEPQINLKFQVKFNENGGEVTVTVFDFELISTSSNDVD